MASVCLGIRWQGYYPLDISRVQITEYAKLCEIEPIMKVQQLKLAPALDVFYTGYQSIS